MRTFESLKAGDRIISKDGKKMECLFWDFYGNGKIRCLADGKSIFPATEFDPEDWEKVRRK